MSIQSVKIRYLFLIITALLCGIIWRGEIEYHGWAGLAWLSYYHWAVPISLCLFIAWANLLFDLPIKKRLLLNFSALIFGIFTLYCLSKLLVFNFNVGPSALLMHFQTGYWARVFYSLGIFLLIPLFPMGTALILRLFKLKTPWLHVLISIILMFLSLPLTVYVLDWTNHIGGANAIHSIKSGVLIPFWLLSMGHVIVWAKKANSDVTKLTNEII